MKSFIGYTCICFLLSFIQYNVTDTDVKIYFDCYQLMLLPEGFIIEKDSFKNGENSQSTACEKSFSRFVLLFAVSL